jgi:phosphoenolpyruvate synthase/pyruvate phosphate dikinase
MPGMMDTVLNLGLNAQTLEGLAKQTGNPSGERITSNARQAPFNLINHPTAPR